MGSSTYILLAVIAYLVCSNLILRHSLGKSRAAFRRYHELDSEERKLRDEQTWFIQIRERIGKRTR